MSSLQNESLTDRFESYPSPEYNNLPVNNNRMIKMFQRSNNLDEALDQQIVRPQNFYDMNDQYFDNDMNSFQSQNQNRRQRDFQRQGIKQNQRRLRFEGSQGQGRPQRSGYTNVRSTNYRSMNYSPYQRQMQNNNQNQNNQRSNRNNNGSNFDNNRRGFNFDDRDERRDNGNGNGNQRMRNFNGNMSNDRPIGRWVSRGRGQRNMSSNRPIGRWVSRGRGQRNNGNGRGRGRGRGRGSGRGRGRGSGSSRGRGRGRKGLFRKSMSKSALDKDLEKYLNKNPNIEQRQAQLQEGLDKELDEYWNSTDLNLSTNANKKASDFQDKQETNDLAADILAMNAQQT